MFKWSLTVYSVWEAFSRKINNQSHRWATARNIAFFYFRFYTPGHPTPTPQSKQASERKATAVESYVLSIRFFSFSNSLSLVHPRDVMRNSRNAVLAMTRRSTVCVRYDGEFFELLAALPSISFHILPQVVVMPRFGYFFTSLKTFPHSKRFLASPPPFRNAVAVEWRNGAFYWSWPAVFCGRSLNFSKRCKNEKKCRGFELSFMWFLW